MILPQFHGFCFTFFFAVGVRFPLSLPHSEFGTLRYRRMLISTDPVSIYRKLAVLPNLYSAMNALAAALVKSCFAHYYYFYRRA